MVSSTNAVTTALATHLVASVSLAGDYVVGLFAGPRVPLGLEQPDSRPVPADPNAFSPPPQPAASVDFDFDFDGKADIARRHPSNSEWKVK
ncbi:MAG: hypothetical protein IPK58_06745 [Acidobacteria bacterium]|nr:hypothetical protein [Acidobacteriota bacterium]